MTHWNQTFTGLRYDLECPDPTSITIQDVAHALSQINRFTGHSRFPYSVAQHSVLGARQLSHEGHTEGVQREFLLHDAHEAHIGDVASPIKRCLGLAWGDFERRHELALRTRFGLPRDMCKAVKEMDLRMLVTEAAQLLTRPPEPWGIPAEPIEGLKIIQWDPVYARHAFLSECNRLGVL